jgi:2-desacetyl-2-hydroxyethyl bacteriochlorophyllide A dehydrogenase
MRGALATGPKTIAVQEIETPAPGTGDVVVAVRACGICGSDLHWWHGAWPAPPVCPGHEIAGEVAAVGRDVAGFKEGDRVAVEGIAACGRCNPCLAGDYHYCRELAIVGMTHPGGFADMIRMPARHCFAVPAGVDFPVAALSEPLAVSVHGVRVSGLEIGQRVLVLGAGTIGLTAVIAARAGGAGEILVTARRPQQRAAALALGADRVIDASDAATLAAAAAESPIDLVVETVGGEADTLETALRTCRAGGTVCLLGAFTRDPTISAVSVLAKEITLKGSMVYNRAGARADFEIVQDLLRRDGARIGAALITHRFPLERIADGFATANDKTTGSIKVTITECQ